MIDSIGRDGDGFLVTASGRVVIDDALQALAEIAAADPPGRGLVVDFSGADLIEIELEDVHRLARFIRDTPALRAQRLSLIHI